MSDDHFLSRWSRRKLASNRGETLDKPATEKTQEALRATPATAEAAMPTAPAPEPLPPVESLTPESDFTPFMKPGVDPAAKQAALRTLFRDPRFNVMDGLDVYIDDYSKPDPMPEEWLGMLNQLARLGDVHAKEAETAKQAENAAAEPQVAQKPQEQQAVEDAKVDESSHTADKEVTPPAVGQS